MLFVREIRVKPVWSVCWREQSSAIWSAKKRFFCHSIEHYKQTFARQRKKEPKTKRNDGVSIKCMNEDMNKNEQHLL